MKTLYCFKYNVETNTIEMQVIPEYDSGSHYPHNRRSYMRFKYNNIVRYAYDSQIDQFKSGRVYTFNPNPIHALNIMTEGLKEKLAKAKREASRYESMIAHIEEAKGNFPN